MLDSKNIWIFFLTAVVSHSLTSSFFIYLLGEPFAGMGASR